MNARFVPRQASFVLMLLLGVQVVSVRVASALPNSQWGRDCTSQYKSIAFRNSCCAQRGRECGNCAGIPLDNSHGTTGVGMAVSSPKEQCLRYVSEIADTLAPPTPTRPSKPKGPRVTPKQGGQSLTPRN
jgi:hypothetical protein